VERRVSSTLDWDCPPAASLVSSLAADAAHGLGTLLVGDSAGRAQAS
jgi:hypothetical protein